jgi:hypothetical protein
VQHRPQKSQHIFSHQFIAFGRAVDAVLLHGSGNGVDVREEEGKQRDVELFRREHVSFIDRVNVVLTIVRREGDAGERNLDSGVLEGGDDGVEVGARGGDGKAAKSVVASELDDNNGRMRGDDVQGTVDAIFGGVSAYAHVEDTVVVATRIQKLLQVIWVAVSGRGAVASGETVSKAGDDGRGFLGESKGCKKKEEQKQETLHV